MKFSIGQGGGNISLKKNNSPNRVLCIGLNYLNPDGWVLNLEFHFLNPPDIGFLLSKLEACLFIQYS